MFAFYLFLLSGFALMVFYGSFGEAVNLLVKVQLGTGFASAERFASLLRWAWLLLPGWCGVCTGGPTAPV
ncbi:MAG: hypothetical protein KIS88_07805 [Anaerolineales bacterium]|nr:hypothetical protein [Anaerolineales bacterium]